MLSLCPGPQRKAAVRERGGLVFSSEAALERLMHTPTLCRKPRGVFVFGGFFLFCFGAGDQTDALILLLGKYTLLD